jgi:galactonate dehydratase
MKIVKVEDLHADAGWRTFSYLKITTDEGLVGWSEFNEAQWNPGLTGVIRKLSAHAIGQDPRAVSRIGATLTAITRMASGGTNQQAVAAIENACLDIKAKALGVPVCALFGGPYREKLQLYWSHCGTFRARNHEFFETVIGTPPLRTLDDMKALGREALKRGYKAVKTNPIVFDGKGADARPRMVNPGFGPVGLDFAQTYDARTTAAICDQLAALREGLGRDTGLMLDLNFSQKPEGLARIAKAVEPFQLTWLEMDLHEPEALATVRRSSSTPVASLESLYGRRQYKPFFQNYAVDVAIIDVPWNGYLESIRIASLAEAFEVNVAPHNFYGHLATMMSAHFCAAIPNFRIMEFEGDDVPWNDDLVTHPPEVKDGELTVPTLPGWGCDVNEDAVRAHPPKQPR